jgi:hypothetical protein
VFGQGGGEAGGAVHGPLVLIGHREVQQVAAAQGEEAHGGEAATALAPAPTLAPALGTSAPEAGAPVAPKPDQDFYDLQYQHLKALKRLQDENLISEAEYQEKREAILKTL